MGWTGLGQSAIGTLALAVIFGGIDLFNAVLSIPITAFQAIAGLIVDINDATFGGLAEFLGAAFGAGAASFGTGWLQFLGIFQTPLGIGVGLLVLWEVLYFLDITDSDVLGFVIDLPDIIANNDDSGIADEDE
ncbi:hypothetical protein C2R22_02455 [Salinigranum rubrum]|uniref:Uncharacterized protein n=1 Tax=Salinigranum rubrum TaxID=755307 RepID=A0A2I8VFF7_9EURY|nr:hypothetical protein [Salinigranum rubrum]AUV80656.1 hypothetical protein C2R22_02455 [Salinigranum rubrum]